MLLFNIFAIFLTICISNAENINQYTVVAPGTIHSPGKYDVAVAVYDTVEPCQIQVGIQGPTYKDSKLVDLATNELKTIHFDVPQVEAGDYYLIAEGLKGITFKNETKLEYVAFVPNVMIQNDRVSYFPNDIIKFRVIFTDENLKPAKPTEQTVIVVEAPNGARFKEYKAQDIKLKHGVISEQLQLPEQYGDWHIKVYSSEKNLSTDVEFSVFPVYEENDRFKVAVIMDSDLSVKDDSAQVVIKAFYFNNNPVNGNVKLSFIVDGTEDTTSVPIPYEAKLINGRATLQIDIQKFKVNEKNNWSYFDVAATVTEDFTDVQISGKSFSKLYVSRYKIETENWRKSIVYEANVEQELIFFIMHVNGTVIKDITAPIELVCTEEAPYYETIKQEPPQFTFEGHANADGEIRMKVKLAQLTKHFYRMQVKYDGEDINVGVLLPTADNTLIKPDKHNHNVENFKVKQLHKNSSNLIVGEEVVFRISYGKGLNYFVYTVVSRGNIVSSERIALPEPVTSYDFKMTPTIPMCPFAHLSFNFIDENGVFHFAEKTIFVLTELENKLEINAPEIVKPGTNVSLHLKTPRNSLVALMGLNQMAMSSFTLNDINYSIIMARLSSYFTRTLWQQGSGKYPGAVSGLVTLTNANYDYDKTPSETKPKYEGKKHDHTPVMLSSQPKREWSFYGVDPPHMYWFYEDIENADNTEFVLTKQLPKDELTTWYVTGFSMNAEHGLAILDKPIKIKSYQSYYVQINLPPTIKIGELLEVQAVVHNFDTNDANDVEITFVANESEFDFVTPNNKRIAEQNLVQRLHVEADAVNSAKFLIRPKQAGDIRMQFHIKSSVDNEYIDKTFKVLPATEQSTETSFADITIKPSTARYKLDMNVCLHEPTDKEYEPTLEISLPSGYVAHLETLKSLTRNIMVKNYKTANLRTTIIIAFKELYHLKDNHETVCIPIVAYKSYNVVLQQPAEVVLRSTYTADKTWTMHYQINSNICDICEMNEDCIKICKNK